VRAFTRYEGDDKLLDEDDRGVMMEWERPLMRAHAEILCNGGVVEEQEQAQDQEKDQEETTRTGN